MVALLVRDGVDLREQPNAGAVLVARLKVGERVEATGPAEVTNGEVWWRVLGSEAGLAGWVRDRDVEVAARATGTPRAVGRAGGATAGGGA